jgi:transcriptional regulator with XRE-family HTH domain
MAHKARLGTALRNLRKERGWTLQEVSDRTGVAVSTLSKAENDQMSLTYDKLVQLTEGLGVDISLLFASSYSAVAEDNRWNVNRIGDGRFISTPAYDHFYLNTDVADKRFVPVLVEVRARSLEEFGELVRHSGEEFAFVVEGTIIVHGEGREPVTLQPGESIYLDSRVGHAFVGAGEGPCRMLSVCSAAEAHIAKTFSSAPQSTLPLKRPERRIPLDNRPAADVSQLRRQKG